MINIFIIHGAYGNPNENWFPYLKGKLENDGHNVIIPKFPTPENQSLISWMKVFEKHLKDIDQNTILIGHSIGVAFVLKILESIDIQIKASYLVSGFSRNLGNPDFDELNKTFLEGGFNWKLINKNCFKFIVYHSDNDPYVPHEMAIGILNKLYNAQFKLVRGAGHFNESSGYKEFKTLYNDITDDLFLG